MRGRFALVVIALVASSASSHANPQSDDEADLLFEEGRVLLEKGDPARACAKFEHALRLEPAGGGIMLNLGLCSEQLGKYKTALYWFRKAELRASESNPPMPTHERVAKEHAATLSSMVATVTIAFAADGASQGAVVKIDGELVSPDDYPRVEVDPGHHTLSAEAPGLAAKQPFDVAGKGGQTLTVALAPSQNAHAAVARTDEPSRRSHTALWIAIGGATSIALAGGLSFYEHGVYTRCTTNGTLDAAKSGCDHATDAYAAALEANDARHVTRVYGTGLFAVGGAALAVAVYLYLTAPAHRERAAIVPSVSRDHVGLALMGEL